MNILVVGSGAREHALFERFFLSDQNPSLYCYGTSNNPGIAKLVTSKLHIGDITDAQAITKYAQENAIDFVVIGPEAPLEAGVADELGKAGIPCIGPTKARALLETDKGYTRDLMKREGIEGCPKYRVFESMAEMENYVRTELLEEFVVKPPGLTGGKGVKVSRDHFETVEEGLAYAEECIQQRGRVVIEEKLVGEEFSFMLFVDNKGNVVRMPLVQDNKRKDEGDQGPNTGGMGSYSCADELLPFVTKEDADKACAIMQKTIDVLMRDHPDEPFVGILYGGFMKTASGIQLIEDHPRFGDPEALNVLALLDFDLVKIFQAMLSGELDQLPSELFLHKATVAKYAVPEGYPDEPVKNKLIDVSGVTDKKALRYGGVEQREDGLYYTTGSRAVASVGIGDTIEEAEAKAELTMNEIKGELFHRRDIGTEAYIEGKIERIKRLLTMEGKKDQTPMK